MLSARATCNDHTCFPTQSMRRSGLGVADAAARRRAGAAVQKVYASGRQGPASVSSRRSCLTSAPGRPPSVPETEGAAKAAVRAGRGARWWPTRASPRTRCCLPRNGPCYLPGSGGAPGGWCLPLLTGLLQGSCPAASRKSKCGKLRRAEGVARMLGPKLRGEEAADGIRGAPKHCWGWAAKVDAHHGADPTENSLLNGGDKVLC